MRRAFAVLATLALAAPILPAQDGGPLTIRATRRDTLLARATVTAAFSVSSRLQDSVEVVPRIDLPPDWTVLMGAAPFTVASGSNDLLMVSVAVPARAIAGVYQVRISLADRAGSASTADSVLVVVPQRRSLDLGLVARPGFVVAGKPYDAWFLLRNRGNVATQVKLSAHSSIGRASIVDSTVRLDAEESRVISARVLTPPGIEAATDDVLEILATQSGDTAEPTHASARVTIVPEPGRKIEEYLRVPAQVHLRAASSDGVSPFVVFGRGPIRDGSAMQVDFLARGPTGRYSAFGERDEYRLDVIAPSWRARAGDNLYLLSSLTAFAQPGFGAGMDVSRGAFTVGGYGQQFRRVPEKGSERGAFVSARPRPDARLALNVVDRAGGSLPGRIGSATASLSHGAINGDLEIARSQSSGGAGRARSARLSGSTAAAAYDIGHQFADTTFAGTQRGSAHDYLTASSQYWQRLWLAVNASTHRTDLSRSTGVPYVERFDVGNVSATAFESATLELGAVARATTIQGTRADAQQRHGRARADRELGFGLLSLEAELGLARAPGIATRNYSDVSVSARHALSRGAVSLWGDRYSGGSITRGAEGTVSLGGDASLRVGRGTDVVLMGYATKIQNAFGQWRSQLDAQVAHTLPNGSSIGLRARLIGGGASSAERSVAYLEYGVPLRVPVSRLRTPGRVHGRVIDAASGRGVPGALVRLGPQVAITDHDGQVAFGGVPAGEHRVSMSQETSFANAVFVGDPTLRVDSARTQPTTFELAIARSARVDVAVRRFTTARTSVAGAPDSLVDAGPLGNATLMLAGERDTLVRTTNDQGAASFTDVPPGRWVITIRGDAPAFHRFDPDRVEVALAPGERKAIAFRLVPRKREVQIIGDGQELRPTTPDPKTSNPTPAIRTGKPNDRPRR